MKKIIDAFIAVACATSTVAYARGGHYAGGHGSSHKGGHYSNPRTHDHYEKRK